MSGLVSFGLHWAWVPGPFGPCGLGPGPVWSHWAWVPGPFGTIGPGSQGPLAHVLKVYKNPTGIQESDKYTRTLHVYKNPTGIQKSLQVYKNPTHKQTNNISLSLSLYIYIYIFTLAPKSNWTRPYISSFQ